MSAINRRQFLTGSLSGLLLVPGINPRLLSDKLSQHSQPPREKPEDRFDFSLGLASYTFRAFSLEQTIAMTRRLGLTGLVLKDFHLPLNSSTTEIEAAAARVRAAGLDLYGCGVVYMEKSGEVAQVFSYARTAGLKMIIASPNPDLLPLIEEKVRESGIAVAIHNHGPGDKHYPTPEAAYVRVKNLDHRIGLCLDIGHAARAGLDPAEEAGKFSDRLLDIHLKDVSAASREGQTVEIGRGVIDLKAFLRTIIKIKYRETLAFEFEKDEKDPLPGVAESVGHIRGLLAGL
ncbi:MAG: sugar phosphate isomerase/epimerase family protein [Candidatus Saccharicenans sp.]|uniref:sugar phosphate isomerase/epimerase family protein n=1 Tax=Candidatus Saccharicenans sp. TaxID=2819258 RepID=UPI00404AD904